MSLLTICQTALREIGEFNVPDSIVGNTDPSSVQLLALANRAGRSLALDLRWQALLATHSFVTVSGTADYALPDDFHRFAELTVFDRSNLARVEGPLSPARWEALRSGNAAPVSAWKYFRLAGGEFSLFPTPDAAETVAFQYYSKHFIDGKAAFSDDADEALIDEDLIAIELRWRFLQAKGASFEMERQEALRRRDALLAKDGGRAVVRFAGPGGAAGAGNLPESGFGA